MSSELIDYKLIEVRHAGQGGSYGEPMTGDDIPWQVREEIGEQIIRDDADSGECEAGGQRYVWRKAETDEAACEMVDLLEGYGPRFSGNNPADEAEDWIDHAFTAGTAREWCELGVWDAGTAAQLRDAGLSADEVAAASESLTEGLDDPSEEYTDGDPIYSVCNCDTPIRTLIDAAKSRKAD